MSLSVLLEEVADRQGEYQAVYEWLGSRETEFITKGQRVTGVFFTSKKPVEFTQIDRSDPKKIVERTGYLRYALTRTEVDNREKWIIDHLEGMLPATAGRDEPLGRWERQEDVAFVPVDAGEVRAFVDAHAQGGPAAAPVGAESGARSSGPKEIVPQVKEQGEGTFLKVEDG